MTMKLIAALALVIFAQNAFADSVTCELTSGDKSTKVTLDLAQPSSDYLFSEDSTYDLSFGVVASEADEEGMTSLDVIITSSQAEDEVGDLGAQFSRNEEAQEVVNEPLTGAPDGRDYNLRCIYGN